jgi:hypothetical protein
MVEVNREEARILPGPRLASKYEMMLYDYLCNLSSYCSADEF